MTTSSVNTAFDVVLKDGERIAVPADLLILDALEAIGVIKASVCKECICGACDEFATKPHAAVRNITGQILGFDGGVTI